MGIILVTGKKRNNTVRKRPKIASKRAAPRHEHAAQAAQGKAEGEEGGEKIETKKVPK